MTGRLEDWTPEQYHASSGVSRGGILDLVESVAVYHGRRVTKTLDEPALGAPAKLGRFAHDAVLRPKVFESAYAIAPSWEAPESPEDADEWDRKIVIRPAFRGKGAKDDRAQWEQTQKAYGLHTTSKTDYSKTKRELWRAEHKGVEEITAREHLLCLGMQAAVYGHDTAGRLVTVGRCEQALTWNDPETNMACKALLDVWLRDGFVCDLKTTGDPSPTGFDRMAIRSRLHVQDAFYTWGEAVRLGVPWHEVAPMTFIVVRSEPPHEVGLYTLGFAERTAGMDVVRSALDRIAACVRADDWRNEWQLNRQPIERTWPDYALQNPLEYADAR